MIKCSVQKEDMLTVGGKTLAALMLTLIGALLPLSAFSEGANGQKTLLKVYKSPTCGCCTGWINHLEKSGFRVVHRHPKDLEATKRHLGIDPRYSSCHTAVSEDGYVFEGHIPAKAIKRFLEEKPAKAVGLAVPGMPVGSPGMEVGKRFTSYKVLLLKDNGGSETYESFDNIEKQYN